MGLFNKIFGAPVEKTATGLPAAGFLPLLGSTPSATGLSISQGTAVAVSTVFACVTIRADDVARCAPRLITLDGDGRQKKIVTDHPVAKLFRRPNRAQTWFEFCQQMHAAKLLRGNAYAVILRDQRGQPVELIPVNPDAVMVLEAGDGSVFYSINRVGLFQMAALRDQPISVPEEDVLHIRGLAFNMLVGASTIGLAREAIGVAMGLEQQAARFMANGARPSGVLKSAKTLTKEAAQRLRDQWEAMRSGIQNIGRTAILEEGLDWTPMQMTSVDAEFMDQRRYSVEEIARFFRVPLHKLGVVGEVSRIRMDQADQAYVNAAIMPDLEVWEQKFERVFDLDAENISVEFDERELLRAEEATRINNGRLAVMSGLKTINEWRAEEGLVPVEGGDAIMRPVNLAAIGSDLSGTAADGAGRPNDGEPPDPGAANQQPKDGEE